MLAHLTIVKDVGRIFDPDMQSLPDWLFPNIAEYEEELLKVDYDCVLGHQFIRLDFRRHSVLQDAIRH